MTLRDQLLALDPVLLHSRNDVAIAAALSAGRKKRVTTEIGNGLILSTIGITAGNALLDILNSQADFRYVKPLLEQGRLDISSDLARAALDGIVAAGAITQEQADAIKALAERDDPVSVSDVSEILNAEGIHG